MYSEIQFHQTKYGTDLVIEDTIVLVDVRDIAFLLVGALSRKSGLLINTERISQSTNFKGLAQWKPLTLC